MSDKIRILLVDSNEMVRIYFRDIFWIHGLEEKYELFVAEDIEKAQKLVRDDNSRPALVFLDLDVDSKLGKKGPEASFSFIQAIKDDPALKEIKIVIFSGHMEKEFQEKAKELGAMDYLKKEDSMPRDLIDFLNKQFSK